MPNIIGARVPDKTSLESDEKREKYALLLMLLLRGFRSRDDLLSGANTFFESYAHWPKSPFVKQIRRNMQDYYETRRKARQFAESRTDELLEQPENVLDLANEDDESLLDDENVSESDSDDIDEMGQWADGVDGRDNDPNGMPRPTPAHIATILNHARVKPLFGQGILPAVVSPQEQVSQVDTEVVRDSMKRSTAQLRPEETGQATFAHTQSPFSVQLFDEALRDASRTFEEQAHAQPHVLTQYPTIAAASKAHNLNEKQHRAFVYFAAALVRTWKRIEGIDNPNLRERTLPSRSQVTLSFSSSVQW